MTLNPTTTLAPLAAIACLLASPMVLADSAGGDVTVVLAATAGDPIEQNNLSQTTPIFTTPIGSDGLFADTLASPIVGQPIVSIDTASVSGDADPFIDLDFAVTNTTGFEAEIVVTAFVPLSAVFGPGLLVDASSSISVMDASNSGFLLGPIPGTAMFEGTIDGAIVQTFFDADTTSPVSQPSGGLDGAGLFTLPMGDVLHADLVADASIGITSNFRLGPGDQAQFSGFFSVVPVIPEPSTISLLVVLGSCYRSRLR